MSTGLLQQAATMDPTGTTAIVNQVAGELQKIFPPGTAVGDWLKNIGDPIGMINQYVKWIKGYKYTGGDYALGEILLNRVAGKATTNRWDTPDDVVPMAWNYFSLLFGIPIAVNTDLDHINTTNYAQGIADYRAGRPERTDVPTNAIQRAITLINMPQMKPTSQTSPQWGLDKFGLLPYVAPIPDPRNAGQMYTGQLPTKQYVNNGIIGDAPSSINTNPLTGGTVQKAGMSGTTMIVLGLAALLIIIGIVMIISKSKK